MTDMDAIRARHEGPYICAYDQRPWPCDAAIVLARLDADLTLPPPNEHEAKLRERGWQDEYEAETAAAMNYGEGFAAGQAAAIPPDPRLDALLAAARNMPSGSDFNRCSGEGHPECRVLPSGAVVQRGTPSCIWNVAAMYGIGSAARNALGDALATFDEKPDIIKGYDYETEGLGGT